MAEHIDSGLKATELQLEEAIVRDPEDIRRRYRENRNWQLFQKEWIYKNIDIKGKDVLDFGCGTGEIAIQLAYLGANRVYGLDVTPGLLDLTRRRAEVNGVADRVETVCGLVQDVEPRPVDVIVAFAVLHHCFPLENMMPALLRWLKPGGVFVAAEPVTYMESLEWLRNHSGVEGDPLDEGERKLRLDDVQYVRRLFPKSETVHFHMLSRFSRLWPDRDMLFRRMDRALLGVPMAWKLAGGTIIVGHKK